MFTHHPEIIEVVIVKMRHEIDYPLEIPFSL
ncbi:Uncharacterised protein [Vibrio cholerae]|nr:Uncharacterised protein [Vibrio cholerae]